MTVDHLTAEELRDVLFVVANAFEDYLRVEKKMPASLAYLEVAKTVRLGQSLAAELRPTRRRTPRLEVVS
jgi:hypothetical protein